LDGVRTRTISTRIRVGELVRAIEVGKARSPCYHAKMIVSFKNTGTEDIFNGASTKTARQLCPESIWRVATRKLDQIDSVVGVEELNVPPGNRLEKLTGDRDGQCFFWSDLGAEEVEIVDYH
jgi:toxin HigB-1